MCAGSARGLRSPRRYEAGCLDSHVDLIFGRERVSVGPRSIQAGGDSSYDVQTLS